MRNLTIQALYSQERRYKVLNSLSVGVRIEENSYSIPPQCIFAMAARNNPKRSYLFVSKLIGKHIPVPPQVPFITGYLLASRLAETLGLTVSKKRINEAASILSLDMDCNFQFPPYNFTGRALFIGFAETATALGHSVFSSFKGDIGFLHTTRENIEGTSDTIYFTEDHCHAPDQRCLVCDPSLLQDNDLLVLIDDEITSGNTCLNIIKTIQKEYPQKKYAVLTLLDWRSERAKEIYSHVEQELGVQIEVISLLRGVIWPEGISPHFNDPLTSREISIPMVDMLFEEMDFYIDIASPHCEKQTYLGLTGRFGITGKENNYLSLQAEKIGKKIGEIRKGQKTLCLGTGEFMYIPFLISRFMGDGILVQSTTRSPVHPYIKKDYAVQYAITFEDPFSPGIKNYVYNVPPDYYDEVFVFWEKRVLPEQVAPLVQSLNRLGISNISFVNFCG